ncbi:acireductone synthase [Vreelandella titanicae]|jgi:enolase-phosphatase E1|uniref:Enolase-phosphatase E1 n=1 Tax=Vreelandella titanicae BH1 TaxID=1204738 RepID=L9U9B6_9GAMM|nr:acireductone synthase [Halomonas titanicae]ELY21231.1 2,3-diketo-5-methylthio-1-phosphopentane phosphatase [Halomonas titanicae BH1]NVE92370.1 acireductone synthase [Halomonas titanicae]|tara:strand:- start:855 stop:1541 length:687 start_codon:yes stop_codon:yes gene_type:complete
MSNSTVRAIVTDIEGTTTDINFVHKVLFPYAHAKLPDFLLANADTPAVAEQIDAVRSEMGAPDATLESVIAQLLHWIETDQKVTPLKALQGMVWADGYQRGDFKGHLYSDVAPALRQWKDLGKALYVYSSGSVQAQKLLFGYSDAGDLTPLFSGYFDTHIGHKREAAAYHRIVTELDLPPAAVLFLSDVVEELDAAKQAGMQTLQLVREGTQAGNTHACVTRFDEIAL